MEKIYAPGSKVLGIVGVSVCLIFLLCAGSYLECRTTEKNKLLKERNYFEVAMQNHNLHEIEGTQK